MTSTRLRENRMEVLDIPKRGSWGEGIGRRKDNKD